MKYLFNGIVAFIGTCLTYLIGGWDATLKILAILMAIDYLTGVMVAFTDKKIDSGVGFKGLLKKATIFLVIIIAHQLDLATGQELVFKTMACYFYIANEGISITENVGNLGVPLPEFLLTALNKIKSENE